ncbi:carbohydrate esterase family 8 protein [Melanomma pulvis-pyrius CBS 109.77]|uniref:pectinesterase n=1 Tax=Melanomma pulvis-pyrius CBS 109.77 TaxID=1314802 RepID=A0A6A6X0K1_9PLEO|nr:carbohydrate esterase family 8 protein [Melanomma pulvis-pyrius CBS 109.77]
MSIPKLVVLLSSFLSVVAAWDIHNHNHRRACQAPSRNPKSGCDHNKTLYVHQTSPTADFRSVQAAVASLPNNTNTYIILIGTGNYTEQVNVTRSGPTYLLGQTTSPKNYKANTVNIIWRQAALLGDNAYTSTLTVAPNLNASLTGSGPTGFAVPDDTPFGCVDFRSYNLNFINDYLPYSATPSLALSISRANGGFYYTGFYSYQDTIYVGKLGNAYMRGGEVAGQTDFFYGFGTLWATQIAVTLRSCGGGITAWKGTNTTFPNKYGVYITDSTILAANSSIAATIYHKCPLGRPWNAQHRSIFARNYLDDSILPAGYIDWSGRYNNYTLQAEYQDYGPGYNATARAASNFTKVLTDREWEPYSSAKKVFGHPDGRLGWDSWVDYDA